MTTPVSAPPSCLLFLDGVRFADGQPDEPDAAPVALTGLQVVFGRETTLDQPAPATCTFTVMDRGGAPRFTDQLRVGARVQVRADATVYPDPTIPTIADASFETRAAGVVISAITDNAAPVKVTAAAAHTGVHAVRIDPVAPARRVRVIFPPADLSAAHDPAAWDTVPRSLPGQKWRYGAAVKLPTALAPVAKVIVRPVAFTQPWPGAGVTVLPGTAKATGPADGNGWVTLSALVLPPAGVWLGVCVDVYPTGPMWDDVPASVLWDDVPASVLWDDLAGTFVDDLVMLAPAAGAARAGEIFTGRITDLLAEFDDGRGAALVKVTAQDDTAELANRYIGEAPWNVEPLAQRFARIVTSSGQAVNYIVDPAAGALPVSYRDVDSQPALGLLQELAASVAGALWSATSLTTGPYLRLEDVNSRPPLQILTMVDGVVVIVVAPVVGATGITLSACSVLLDPVRWEQDTSDVATRVVTGWRDQTDPVKPADRSVSSIDAAAERADGRRRVQISTQLTTSAQAQQISDALLGRLSAGGWRIRGLTYRVELLDELSPEAIAVLMTILDGTTRIGLPIMLVDLPTWSPVPADDAVPLYLEGGRFTNTDGCWTIELLTSSAQSTGAGTVQWDQVPAEWLWDTFDPAISWNDLNGVGL